jgi:hypothetical protein
MPNNKFEIKLQIFRCRCARREAPSLYVAMGEAWNAEPMPKRLNVRGVEPAKLGGVNFLQHRVRYRRAGELMSWEGAWRYEPSTNGRWIFQGKVKPTCSSLRDWTVLRTREAVKRGKARSAAGTLVPIINLYLVFLISDCFREIVEHFIDSIVFLRKTIRKTIVFHEQISQTFLFKEQSQSYVEIF